MERVKPDLYCLTCGYNLRGLSGDPRRCPECGQLNAIGDMRVPAEATRAQLRTMETAPNWCVAAVLAVVLAMTPLLASIRSLADVFNPPPCFVWFAGFWGFVALTGAIRFRSSCGACEGWAGALARYIAYSLLLILGTLTFILSLGSWISGTREPISYWSGVLVMVAGMATILARAAPWVQRRVREIIQPLQREVARQLVYDKYRRRLQIGVADRRPRENQPFQ